jgi:hypothetical protein
MAARTRACPSSCRECSLASSDALDAQDIGEDNCLTVSSPAGPAALPLARQRDGERVPYLPQIISADRVSATLSRSQPLDVGPGAEGQRPKACRSTFASSTNGQKLAALILLSAHLDAVASLFHPRLHTFPHQEMDGGLDSLWESRYNGTHDEYRGIGIGRMSVACYAVFAAAG